MATLQEFLRPARGIAESFAGYRVRRLAATHARRKPFRWHGVPTPLEKYVVGPHRTHQPHVISKEGVILSEHGVPMPHVFRVTHPSTLVKKAQ